MAADAAHANTPLRCYTVLLLLMPLTPYAIIIQRLLLIYHAIYVDTLLLLMMLLIMLLITEQRCRATRCHAFAAFAIFFRLIFRSAAATLIRHAAIFSCFHFRFRCRCRHFHYFRHAIITIYTLIHDACQLIFRFFMPPFSR